MVTRLMLSLREAANAPGSIWGLSNVHQLESLRFAQYTVGGSELGGGDIALGNLPSGR